VLGSSACRVSESESVMACKPVLNYFAHGDGLAESKDPRSGAAVSEVP
jgi:hypothetical protein